MLFSEGLGLNKGVCPLIALREGAEHSGVKGYVFHGTMKDIWDL